MRKKLALLVAVLACLGLATAGAADTGPTPKFNRTVYIVNRSSMVSNQELAAEVPAYQAEADAFGKYWGGSYHLELTGAAPARSWVIYVYDHSDVANAAGYHTMTKSGIPVAKAFAADSPGDLSVTISHEEVEMMADPRLNRGALVDKWYLVEVGDPVESDLQGWYSTAGGSPVLLSDFVLPTFYSASTTKGAKYDYVGDDKAPLHMLTDGYMSFWMPGEGWLQEYARGHARHARFLAFK